MPRSSRMTYYAIRSLSRTHWGRACLNVIMTIYSLMVLTLIGMLLYAMIFEGLWIVPWDLLKGIVHIILYD